MKKEETMTFVHGGQAGRTRVFYEILESENAVPGKGGRERRTNRTCLL